MNTSKSNNTETRICTVCGAEYEYTDSLPWLAESTADDRICDECRAARCECAIPQRDDQDQPYRPVIGYLSTEHAASSYGQPVMVVDGEAYGPGEIMLWPSDLVSHVRAREAGYKIANLRADDPTIG
jgi:hypothetical protein